MFGIEDTWVALAYLACLGSTLLCVVYGVLNWNRGEEIVDVADSAWAAEEDKVEEKL